MKTFTKSLESSAVKTKDLLLPTEEQTAFLFCQVDDHETPAVTYIQDINKQITCCKL